MSMLRGRTLSRWLAVLALASASCTAIDPPPASPPEFRPLHTRATLHLGEKELADGRFVGLAFSGGGSRAAVFGAAVLGLAMAGLVTLADLYFMRNRPRTENLS